MLANDRIDIAGAKPYGRSFLCAIVVLIALLNLIAVPYGSAAPVYPQLTGRIVDDAGLLNPADRASIATELAALEQKSSDQLVIVTVTSLQGYAIEDYSIGLARIWGIGQQGKDNGVVLLIAPNERKVRIEVGRRLEPLLTDTMSKLIIQNAILPGFRRGDYSAGIRAGVRDIKDVLLGDSEAVRNRARRQPPDFVIKEEWIALAFWLTIVVFMIWIQYRQSRRSGSKVKRRRRTEDGSVVVIPSGRSDNWSGGWSGGGGGWSGGGGSFGGGGASGSW